MNTSGVIYAIGVEGGRSVKIGRTSKPIVKRLATLQIASPSALTLFAHVPVEKDLIHIEKAIHRFLQTERQQGEWFALSVDQEGLESLILRAIKYVEIEKRRKGIGEHSQSLDTTISIVKKRHWQQMGDRLRVARRNRNLTGEELAEHTGTTRATISQLENGRKPGVSFDVLLRIAEVLGVSLDYLAGRKDDEKVGLPTMVA